MSKISKMRSKAAAKKAKAANGNQNEVKGKLELHTLKTILMLIVVLLFE